MADAKLTPEVRAVLERSEITNDRLILPPGQLDRGLYEAVNKVLVNAGGKWNRSAKAHIFNGDPRAKLGLALETGVSVDEKKKFQAFYTPAILAKRLAALAGVKGKTVLEPSAGRGAIAEACREAGAAVDCVELNPEDVEVLNKMDYLVEPADFLRLAPAPIYDRVVMNPPFTKGQDWKHVQHALKFLKPGGVLVAVVMPNALEPDSKLVGVLGKRTFETWPVEAGTFKESGTPIATRIIRVEQEAA